MTGFALSDGRVLIDGTPLAEVTSRVEETPFFIYSAGRLQENLRAWTDAFPEPHLTAAAIKANSNLHLVERAVDAGCGVCAVSGGEVELAREAGCPADRIVLNGNGKTDDDLRTGLAEGILLNIDSEFDLRRIADAAAESETTAECLVRINPEVDAAVHPYLSTALEGSKFGVAPADFFSVLETAADSPHIELRGLHFHLGSTLDELSPVEQALEQVPELLAQIRKEFPDADLLNVGGGLGIDYHHEGKRMPRPADLADLLLPETEELGVKLITEPGRSIFADTGVVVTEVLGTKRSGEKNFAVVDGSMALNPRPALYDSYHRITPLEADSGAERAEFDVVGPVCESADVLGEDRELPAPEPGDRLCVWEAGAYCYTMASRYNLRLPPAEYLWDGEAGDLVKIRRGERLGDVFTGFCHEPV